jgi:polyferredoxin
VFQLVLLAVAALVIYDGFTGPQLAPANSATVLVWIHYRGLVILGLLLVGNLFCSACPFTLPRTLARRFSLAGRRWPRRLRNKWVSLAGLLVFFWIYESLDLWASPWLTAWLALAYFVGSFLLEALFAESPFCKYVCPLGAFNFVQSTMSPLQITARSPALCLDCQGKECVRGSARVPGCGTELYVPMIQSNMDCTLCLDCARACPYDNVALQLRSPLYEATSTRWPVRWDLSMLVFALTFMALANAFGMVPPIYAVQDWMAGSLGVTGPALQLLLIQGTLTLVLPGVLLWAAAWASQRAAGGSSGTTRQAMAARYAPTFIPLGLGFWIAHYGFHLAIGGLTILPVLQALLQDHGLALFGGRPAWGMGALLPAEVIFPLQVLAVMLGFCAALYSQARQALRHAPPRLALRQLLPWALVAFLLTLAALQLFNLPMEMRGTFRAT